MAMPEGISVYLENLDLKKNNLRKAILNLAVEWKNLDEHSDLTNECSSEYFSGLESERKKLDSIRESVIESNRELEAVRESLEARQREMECREENFISFQQKQLNDFEIKEKQLTEIRTWVMERMEEVESKNEKLSEQKESMELLLKEFRIEKHEYEDIKKDVGAKLNEISLREKNIDDRSKELHLVQDWVEKRAKILDSKEEEIIIREQLLKDENMLFEKCCKEFESKEKQFEERSKKFDSVFKQFEEKSNDFVLKKRKLEESCEEFESKEKQLEEQKNDKLLKVYVSKRKALEQRCNNFDKMDTKLKGQVKAKEIEYCSEKNLSETKHHYNEQVNDMPGMDFPTDIQVIVTFGGLQLFMIDQFNEYESLSSKLCKILRLSQDPSELVLDVVEFFYPFHMEKGEMEFKNTVARRSCLILLEQLMEISPRIQPRVKEKALSLAVKLKVNLEENPKNPLDVMAYFWLLATYKLTSNFDANENLQFLEFVPMSKGVAKLCRSLGLQEKASDLIERLIKENQHLKAIKYIAVCGLVYAFPPVPLLKDYLNISKKIGKIGCQNKNPSHEAKDRKINDRVACVRDIIRCIVDNKIECGNWCSSLENYVKQLQKKKYQKTTKPDSDVVNPTNHSEEIKLVSTSPFLSPLLANMDGNNLLLFLSKHLEVHELMRDEVYVALRTSSEPGKIVLNATKVFLSPVLVEVESGIDMRALKSCIFLFDILISLEPVISSNVKEASRKLAVDWKVNAEMREENSLLKLGFSRFLSAYGLTSAFDPDDNLNLDNKDAHTPKINYALGCSEYMPVLNFPEYEKQINQSAEDMKRDKIPDFIFRFPDPAKIILDAIEGCYFSKAGSQKISKLEVLKSLNFSLDRLLKSAVEVTEQIKEQAIKIAADWKEKVKRQGFSEVWCFLLFLATFKVNSFYDKNELFDLLEIVFSRKTSKDAANLVHSLGLENEIPKFINMLVEREMHLDAIKYICAFELGDKFPPDSLIKDYISYEEAKAKKIREKGCYSVKAKENATNRELNALEAVVNCSRLHRLESQYPLKNIEARIKILKSRLKKQRLVTGSSALYSASKAQLEERDGSRSKEIHNKKRKFFFAENENNRADNFPRPTVLELPYQHPQSVYPSNSPPYLIPHEGYYSSFGSIYHPPNINCPSFGFGNVDDFNYPNNSYNRSGGTLSGMRYRPPVRDQMHWQQ